ncbi:hypothetical protein QR680_010048 [Steinernema hermaphroditum]|uniref:Uncharacterized protein n=1 Tax=Steinernema hermaphroditum TaxID=289476 RepID=A0AA39IMJ3_9BILA|nr:hypothetical protein QR680_010048 [Steinernema hermaphroditum]
MNLVQQCQGLTQIVIATTGLPVYLRILYVFASSQSLRKRKCYRIMIQIGIVQCLFAPGSFFHGILNVLGYDPFGLASLTVKLLPSVVRMEAFMSLVLALNRLKLICDISYSKHIHTTMMFVIWFIGLCLFALSFTYLYGYTVAPTSYAAYYEYWKPFTLYIQQIGFGFHVLSTCITLTVYIFILIYIFRRRFHSVQNAKVVKERKILIYAGTRFVFDIVLTLFYGYVQFHSSGALKIALTIGYPLNHLCLPPFLYLAMHRELRGKF